LKDQVLATYQARALTQTCTRVERKQSHRGN